MKALNKIGLLILPFAAILTSCGGSSEALVHREAQVYTAEDRNDSTKEKYKVMEYSIGIISGKAKIASLNDFTAKVGTDTISAVTLFDSVRHRYSSSGNYHYYGKQIQEIDLPDNDTSSVSVTVYVAFPKDTAFTNESEFYFLQNKITTSSQTITIK